MNHGQPQARQIRECRQEGNSPQSRLILVREQSVFVFSPRQRTRHQAARSRDQGTASTFRDLTSATGMETPRAGRDPDLAVSTSSPLTCIGHESELAANCPRHPIALAISKTVRFPVYIHINSSHVRI